MLYLELIILAFLCFQWWEQHKRKDDLQRSLREVTKLLNETQRSYRALQTHLLKASTSAESLATLISYARNDVSGLRGTIDSTRTIILSLQTTLLLDMTKRKPGAHEKADIGNGPKKQEP